MLTHHQLPGSHDGAARYQLIPRVLCFVTSGDEVLLLKGAPDKKLWPGKYNGLGGHVERGESVHAAARREIREEAGIEVSGLRLRGVITIDTGGDPGIGMFVFTAEAVGRDYTASAEGSLEWVPQGRLAALDTVDDLPVLVPYLFRLPPHAPPFSAQYRYDPQGHLLTGFYATY